MTPRHYLLLAGLAVLGTGCATQSGTATGTAEPKMTVAEETYVPVGSHIRSRRGKPKTAPAATMSGEEFSRQAKTDQIYPTGEQIINARNGP